MSKTENVPKALKARYEEIVSITNEFSQNHLDEEYAQEIRFAVAALCRKRPSPLEKGKAASWACGVTHAVGLVNFLFDKSQSPHVRASVLYKGFGIAESTGQGKSKSIRDILKIRKFDPNWTLPSKLSGNPMLWMLR
ncbi:MAG: DUF6398 domain-containing protein [Psychromonas sp.]